MLIFIGMVLLAYLCVLTVVKITNRSRVASLYGLFCAFLVLANVLATKIITVGSFSVPAGIVLFSMTFLITDYLNETGGFKEAQKLINIGMIVNIMAAGFIALTIALPAPEFAADQANNFSNVLGSAPRIVLAGLIAFIISQYLDITIFSRLKTKDKNKKLWLRNNVSTIVSQLIDSVIFIVIAFGGVLPLIPLITGQFVVKMLIAIFDTPFLYWMVNEKRLDK